MKSSYGKREGQKSMKIKGEEGLKNMGIMFSVYCDYWMINIKPSCIENIEPSCIEKHIKPYLGGYLIQDIDNDLINSYLESLRAKTNLSHCTIMFHHGLLYNMFGLAIDLGLLSLNPVMPCWSEDTIVDATKIAEGSEIEIPLLLALYGGLRVREILALRFRDINFKSNQISVNNALSDENHEIKLKQFTHQRDVALSPKLMDIIEKHKEEHDKKKLKTEKYTDNDLVVAMDDGRFMNPRFLSRLLKKFIEDNNLPDITFWGLRRMHIALLIEIGVDLLLIQKKMGLSMASILNMAKQMSFYYISR